MQFLGGYDSNNDNSKCYEYKLHKHKQRKKDKKLPFIVGLEFSLKFCDTTSVNYIKNTTLSDYLKNVTFDTESDYDNIIESYRIDDTHFYYHAGGIDEKNYNESSKITLCFDDDTSSTQIVSETEFCMIIENDDSHDGSGSGSGSNSKASKPLCTRRGIFVTDICGLDSDARLNSNLPPSSIDFIPRSGDSYDILKAQREGSEHGGDLTKGRGTFKLISNLVVLRGWWIDECIITSNQSASDDDYNIIIRINDDYIDTILNNTFVNFSVNTKDIYDLIDSPITLPIYDHFIVSSECEHINGKIVNVKYDNENQDNEEFELYINLYQSPLIYFENANFDATSMNVLEYSNDINDLMTGPPRPPRRMSGMNGMKGGRKTRRKLLSASIGIIIEETVSRDVDIEYKNQYIGNCAGEIDSYLLLEIGFSLDYSWNWFTPNLDKIKGSITASAGIGSILTCTFGEESDDGTISASIFDRRFESLTTSVTLGVLKLDITPYLELSMIITRPALQVVVSPYAEISGSVTFEAGWAKSGGSFASIQNNLDFDYGVDVSYPGSATPDGERRLESSLGFYVTPGILFGLYGVDIFYIAAPLGLPEFTASLSLNLDDDDCNFAVELTVDVDFTATVELGIETIELFGSAVFFGSSWSPNDPLYSKNLASFTVFEECFDNSDDINAIDLFDSGFTEYTLKDYQYIHINTGSDTSEDDITWPAANSYCNLVYGTNLATVTSASNQDELIDMLGTSFSQKAWVGLNDRQTEGEWVWADKYNTTYNASLDLWASGEPNGGTTESCGSYGENSEYYDLKCTDRR